jgi:peptide deformylase
MEILKYPNDLLKTKCNPVTEFNDDLVKELDQMLVAMDYHKGVGLSANQVGINKSMFVMRDNSNEPIYVVNPRVIQTDDYASIEEGCLSLPGVYIKIPGRPNTVVAEYQGVDGQLYEGVFTGLEAVCFVHEFEHLQGKFFLENVSRTERRAALSKARR